MKRKITLAKIGLIGIVSSLGATILGAATISCAQTHYLSKRDLRDVLKTENKITWYQYTGGGLTDAKGSNPLYIPSDAIKNNLLRVETLSELGKKIKSLDQNKKLVFADLPQPISKIKFDLADQIIITTWDNKIRKISTNEELNNEFNKPYDIQKPSSNIIASAKKIAFHIRDNYWTTWDGKKTQYKIKPSDFLYTINRKQLLDNQFRIGITNNDGITTIKGHGGNKELDDIVSSQGAYINQGWMNRYLYKMFGYNINKMIWTKQHPNPEKNKNICDDEKGILTFDTDGIKVAKRNLLNSFREFFGTNGRFDPAPSEYIKSQKFQNAKFKYTKNSGTKIPTEPTGVAAKYGFYRYGQTYKDVLYSGAYRMIQNSRTRIRFVQNENYWDKKWLKRTDTVHSYTQDYVPTQDVKIFQKSLFEQYKFGREWRLSYKDADVSTKKEIKSAWRNNQNNIYGARYGKKIEKNKNLFNFILSQTTKAIANPNKYWFNNNYAKVMYGNNLSDVSKNTVATENQTIHSALGSGKSFESIIKAAINWYAINNIVDPNGTSQPWLINSAPETVIKPGLNQEELINYNNEINTTTAYGFIGDETNGLIDPNNKISVTMAENKAFYNAHTDNTNIAITSPAFARLKVMMKDLLDKLHIGNDQKITFPILNRHTSDSGAQNDVARKYIKTVVNRLDPRINITWKRRITGNNFNTTMTTGATQYDYFGWQSDYGGIGGMISGWLNSIKGLGKSTAFIQTFVNLLNNKDKLIEAYPEMIHLATRIKNVYNQMRTRYPGDFIAWEKIKTIRGNDFRAVGFKNIIINVLGDNFNLKALFPDLNQPDYQRMETAINGTKKLSGEARYLAETKLKITISNIFWAKHDDFDSLIGLEMLSYQTGFKATEQKRLMELIKEMEGLISPMIGVDTFIANRNRPEIKVHQNYITQTQDILSGQIFLRDWRIGNRKEQ